MFLCVPMGPFACVLTGKYASTLVFSGSLLVLIRPYESLWILMRRYVSSWVLMSPYKSLCV